MTKVRNARADHSTSGVLLRTRHAHTGCAYLCACAHVTSCWPVSQQALLTRSRSVFFVRSVLWSLLALASTPSDFGTALSALVYKILKSPPESPRKFGKLWQVALAWFDRDCCTVWPPVRCVANAYLPRSCRCATRGPGTGCNREASPPHSRLTGQRPVRARFPWPHLYQWHRVAG